MKRTCTLAPDDWRMLLSIHAALPLVRVAIVLLGVGNTFSILDRFRGRPVPNDDDAAETIVRAKRWIGSLKHRAIYRGNCLSQSLVLWWLLRRRGICTNLRIGAQRDHARVKFHAWVEYHGHPINERRNVHQRFSAFREFVSPELLAHGSKAR